MRRLNGPELVFRMMMTIILSAILLVGYVNYPRTPATVIDFKATKNEYRIGETLAVSSVSTTHVSGTFDTLISVRCANGIVSYSLLDIKQISITKSEHPVETGEVVIGTIPREIASIFRPHDNRIECRVVATSTYHIELRLGLTQTIQKIDVTPFFVVLGD